MTTTLTPSLPGLLCQYASHSHFAPVPTVRYTVKLDAGVMQEGGDGTTEHGTIEVGDVT